MQNNVTRGFALSVFFQAAVLVSLVNMGAYVFYWSALYQERGAPLLYSTLVLGVLRCYAIYLMWYMYRLGYILYAVIGVIFVAVIYLFQHRISASYICAVSIIIFFILVLKNKWRLMRWHPKWSEKSISNK